MGTLKVISEFYPSRLHKAFVIDPPSIFSCLWKGARPFVDLWAVTSVVSSLDYDDSLEDATFSFSCPHRTTSLRFEHASVKSDSPAGSTSSRFAFTVSHLNSLKPWYLSSVGPTTSSVAPTSSPSLVGVSPLNARSFSFASPGARSTPLPQQTPRQQPRTPRPSFLQSPSILFSSFHSKKNDQHNTTAAAGGGGPKGGGEYLSSNSKKLGGKETFVMYLRFYTRPYDEMVYRAKMRPPLGGLVSIVSSQGRSRRYCGASGRM